MSDVSKTNDRMSEVRLAIMETLNDPIMKLVLERDPHAWSAGLAMKLCNETLAADALEAANSERDAVPDAATERYKDAAEGNRIPLVHAQNDAERFEAERDAALAALDRVRAVADHWSSDEDAKGLHFDLVAELDGAPEPEVKP